MTSCWLRRGLPFLFTFVFGVASAVLLKPAQLRETFVSDNFGFSQGRCHHGQGLAQDRYDSSEVPVKAHIFYKPAAPYTENAVRSEISGDVLLQVVLSADGTVRGIEVIKGLPGGLTGSAVEAARKIQFTPAMKDGHAVSQIAQITYNFDLIGKFQRLQSK